MQHEADPADRFVIDGDREQGLGRPPLDAFEEFARVAPGVRMRKGVAEVDPDVAVVGVFGERVGVRCSPGAHRAPRQRELHFFFVFSVFRSFVFSWFVRAALMSKWAH